MWSLPNIVKLNDEAARTANKFLKAVHSHKLDGKVIRCGHCERRADVVYPYYDIFSDDPKGIVGLCDEHDGISDEGLFTCDGCGRIMVENYTWERYCASDPETDEVLCLCCFAERELAKVDNWLELTEERIDQVDFEEVRRCKHLLAVNQPAPKSIQFVENVELDSSSGGRLTSCSTCESTPDGAVHEIQSILLRLKSTGFTKAFLILDAAYQFSISIGVYVRAAEARDVEPDKKAA
jgi:hypothetical protein